MISFLIPIMDTLKLHAGDVNDNMCPGCMGGFMGIGWIFWAVIIVLLVLVVVVAINKASTPTVISTSNDELREEIRMLRREIKKLKEEENK